MRGILKRGVRTRVALGVVRRVILESGVRTEVILRWDPRYRRESHPGEQRVRKRRHESRPEGRRIRESRRKSHPE